MLVRVENGSSLFFYSQKLFIGPSSTQLYTARTMLESLIADKSSARCVKTLIDLMATYQFHKNTFYCWNCLLNFNGMSTGEHNWTRSFMKSFYIIETLQQLSDLLQLRYQKFYLEMTMGKRIQVWKWNSLSRLFSPSLWSLSCRKFKNVAWNTNKKGFKLSPLWELCLGTMSKRPTLVDAP